MKTIRSLFLGIMVTSLFGCSSISSKVSKSTQKDYSLARTEQQLKPGASTQADIARILGKPDMIAPAEKSLDVAWLYLNDKKDETRVSFIFDGHAVLKETNWWTTSGDPENDLKIALSRFPTAHFVRTSLPWTTQHSAPDPVDFYTDDSLGVTISYYVGHKYVADISFSKPTGTLAHHE